MTFPRQDRRPPRGEGAGGMEDSVIKIDRFAKVVKGGRRFSFGALVVVGDRGGRVGMGYGKANEVPQAVDKAVSVARRSLFTVPLKANTIPHLIKGRCGASKVILVPAAPGTGVIAGKAIRSLLQLAGVKDVLTKAYGSTNPVNLLKAGVDALVHLRTAETITQLRGVKAE